MQRKSEFGSDLVSPRPLTTLLVCAAACSIAAGTLLALLRSEEPSGCIDDTWTATNTENAPTGRYDPATNSWIAINPDGTLVTLMAALLAGTFV